MESYLRKKLTMLATNDQPLLLGAAACAALAFSSWCVWDYQQYLALGPGGPPYNVRGWAWITFGIRPFALSKSGATMVKDYPAHGCHEAIEKLPARKGERARLGGIAPHRQLSQHAPKHLENEIRALFSDAAQKHADVLEIRKSEYERHHDALFVAKRLIETRAPQLPETAIIARGEVGHVHPDLSIHVYLSPADARAVIEKGWAERHRLSVPKDRWVKNKYAIASTYLMLYGPRDSEEMDVVRTILECSIKFMTGRDLVEK